MGNYHINMHNDLWPIMLCLEIVVFSRRPRTKRFIQITPLVLLILHVVDYCAWFCSFSNLFLQSCFVGGKEGESGCFVVLGNKIRNTLRWIHSFAILPNTTFAKEHVVDMLFLGNGGFYISFFMVQFWTNSKIVQDAYYWQQQDAEVSSIINGSSLLCWAASHNQSLAGAPQSRWCWMAVHHWRM